MSELRSPLAALNHQRFQVPRMPSDDRRPEQEITYAIRLGAGLSRRLSETLPLLHAVRSVCATCGPDVEGSKTQLIHLLRCHGERSPSSG
ncbi:hypothetical protein V5799_007150 [Amblyomma americanum]|uniref:Uncharacterized protein n=1 Tax=Amblyomma americanum TaxID=6943 RepID=A0AAQ4DUD0_AMBAM